MPAVQRALREARERAERRVAAEAARRSEKELLDVIEAIPTMAFTTLADGGSVWVNRRWVEYTDCYRLASRRKTIRVEQANWMAAADVPHRVGCVD